MPHTTTNSLNWKANSGHQELLYCRQGGRRGCNFSPEEDHAEVRDGSYGIQVTKLAGLPGQ